MDTSSLEAQLIHEVWRNDLEAVKHLLASGANPNKPGRAWSSAIACAGENDRTGEVAQALARAGADINIQDEHGTTPLHHAVDIAIDGAIQNDEESFDWTVVGVFLTLGADPQIRDRRGKTVFDCAAAYGDYAHKSFSKFMASR